MSMVSTIQDRAVGFLKAHPKATNAVCKVGEYATVGAGAGTVAVMGAVAASADEPTSSASTVDISVAESVVDTLVAAAKSIVSSTFTKGIGVLAVVMAVNFGVRKVRSFIGA